MQMSRAVLVFIASSFVGCTGAIASKGREAPAASGGDGGHGGEDGMASGGEGASEVRVGPAQWRRLSGDQYINIIKDVLGVEVSRSVFLADTMTGRFATNILPAQDIEVDRYASAAETVADKVDAKALAACAGANRACAEKILNEIAPRLYRKKLQAEESKALLALFDLGNVDGFKTGASLMFRSMLQSPSFLYLVEVGERDDVTGLQKLGSYEIAARLALVLWKSAPDASLLAAAEAGELSTTDQVEQAAERMMNDPRFGLAVADFHLQLFHVNKLTREGAIGKASLGGFSPEIRQAMVDETTAFINHAIDSKEATIATMLTAKHSFPPQALLAFNGIPRSSVKANGRVDYSDDGKRAGLLTMSGFMTAEPPTPTDYGAVQRGKMIRENLLCQHIPQPPPGLNFTAPPDAATTPQRVLLQQHQDDPTCKNCHKLMDNIGFAFENYDAFGRYRAAYPLGETVDPSGLIEGNTDVDGDFTGPGQLGAMLARSKDVRNCVAGHWFRYAVGREPTEEDDGSVETLAQSLAQGAGDIPSALLAFVQSSAFRFIQGVQ